MAVVRDGGHVAAVALVPATVLVFDPGGLAPFGPAKWLVVPSLVLAALAVTVLRFDRRFGIAWLAFVGWVAITAAVGLDHLPAWIGTDERRFGALAWVLCALAHLAGQQLDERARRRLALAAAATTAVVGAVVVGELFGLRAVELVGAGERPVATMGSSAFLGAAMALLVPVAAGAVATCSGRARAGVAIGTGLGVLALVASGARAAWVGAAVAGAVSGWRHRDRLRLVAPAVAFGAVAVVALAFATGVSSRVPDAFRDERGGLTGRLDEWRIAVGVVGDHLVTGTGPEGYRIAFGAAVDAGYERRHGLLLGLAAGAVRHAVVGGDAVRAGFATGALAYGVQSLLLFPLAHVDPLAWLLVGACAGTAAGAGRERTRRVPGLRPVAIVLALGFAIAGVAGVAADRAARRGDADAAAMLRPDVLGHRLLVAAGHEEVGSSAGLDRAIDTIAGARRLSPDDPAVRSEWTRLLLARARRTGTPRHVDLARLELERLARIDPRNAEVLLRLGVARSLDGDDGGAESAWKRAEHLAPRSAAASVDLAIAYAAQGRSEEAIGAARRALARDPGNAEATAVLRRLGAADGT